MDAAPAHVCGRANVARARRTTEAWPHRPQTYAWMVPGLATPPPSVARTSAPAAVAAMDEAVSTRDGADGPSAPVAAGATETADKRALLAALPADADRVLAALASIGDAWWVAAASVAAVRAGTDWLASDALRVLAYASERTSALDADVATALADAGCASPSLAAWLDADPVRLARVVLRRKLWHMQWLLSIPLAAAKSARVPANVAALADRPLLAHAHDLCLAGNARGLRALLGAHATVARSLFSHRFELLHVLLTVGGVPPERLLALRLLPGTHLPVEDRESDAWVDALEAPPPSSPSAAAMWVDHPAVVHALADRGASPFPTPPPPPPAALWDWYAAVMTELESELGLVDAALGLANAGVHLGLKPLSAAAQELAFLHELVYHMDADLWRVQTLRAASAHALVARVAQQPWPAARVAAALHEQVVPFLQLGTYADAAHGRHRSASAWGLHMALMVRDAVPLARALEVSDAMLARAWLDEADQHRLVLALLATSEAADAPSFQRYTALLQHVSPSPPPPRAIAPLTAVLGRALGARAGDVDATHLCEQAALVSPAVLQQSVQDVHLWVQLAETVAQLGVAHAPRYYWADTQAERAHTVMQALVRHALRARGSEPSTLVRMLTRLAPFLAPDAAGGVGAPWVGLPSSCVRVFFRELLLAREPVLFNELVSAVTTEPACAPVAQRMTARDAEALVLNTARAWIHQAPTCDPLHGSLQRARETLDAAPHTPQVEAELSFLALLARLHEHGASIALTPQQVRATPRKLDLLARVLSLHGEAYRAPHIRALADACSEAPGDDVHVCAMLADAAAASGDWRAARDQCERIVQRMPSLPRAQYAAAWDVAWRTCLQLAKHPQWPDPRSRAVLLGHALALAPPAHIPTVLQALAALPPHTAAPVPPRRAERHTLARLLTRPSAPSAAPRHRTAQLFDSVAAQHAPQAARMARSLLGHLGSGWWSDERAPS